MIALNSAFENDSIYVTAFIAGLLLHIFVFRLGEWDASATDVITCFAGLYIAVVAGSIFYLPPQAEEPWTFLKLIL